MKDYCENEYCESSGAKVVSVSVSKPSDQTRTLCAACEEVYTWGVQHGRITSQTKEVWLVAIADRGIVSHVQAYPDAKTAIKALAAYLAEFNEYTGPADIRAIRRWLRQHDENLSVEITFQEGLCPAIDSKAKYTLCRHCDHFVDKNDAFDGSCHQVARFIHLEDGEQEFDHDAEPSTKTHLLEEWRRLRPDLFKMHPDGKIGPNSAHHSRRGKID
jgi:hypothetical protein